MDSADRYIQALGLSPHPEGGSFRVVLQSERRNAARPTYKHIYYLLRGNEVSRLHRLDCDEVINFYNGYRVCIVELINCSLPPKITLLGGEQLSHSVPTGTWFGMFLECDDTYVLLGCTTVPGYEASGFELADRNTLLLEFPYCVDAIDRLAQ